MSKEFVGSTETRNPVRRAARYPPSRQKEKGGRHWCGPLNANVRQGGPYNKYCDGACFLAPPFPPPLPISAPSSSSTLIKNSYILISRGCVVPRVATHVPRLFHRSLCRVSAICRKKLKHRERIFPTRRRILYRKQRSISLFPKVTTYRTDRERTDCEHVTLERQTWQFEVSKGTCFRCSILDSQIAWKPRDIRTI